MVIPERALESAATPQQVGSIQNKGGSGQFLGKESDRGGQSRERGSPSC